jgi:hypothetical protein
MSVIRVKLPRHDLEGRRAMMIDQGAMYCSRCGRPLDLRSRACHTCGLDTFSSEVNPPQPPLSKREKPIQPAPKRRRRRWIRWVLGAVAIYIVVVAVGTAISGTDESHTVDPAPSLASGEVVGNTLNQQLAASIDISLEHVRMTYEDGEYKLEVFWAYRNRTFAEISAWQFTFEASVIDGLGRKFERTFLVDCTGSPLAAGQTRRSGTLSNDTAVQQRADSGNCTRSIWARDPYSYDDNGLWVSLETGSHLDHSEQSTVVVFADGTQIGTAR